MDLALNNLQRLICQQTKPNPTNQTKLVYVLTHSNCKYMVYRNQECFGILVLELVVRNRVRRISTA